MNYHVKEKWVSKPCNCRNEFATPRDHHQYGYETEHDFSAALHRLHSRWSGWTGTEIGRRNGFIRLRFVGVYGDVSNVWLPDFMLERVPEPMDDTSGDSTEELLDEIFKFD